MNTEKQIERAVVAYAESKDCFVVRLENRNARGWMDLTILTPNGVTGFAEIKKPGGRLSPQQKYFLKELQRLQVPVIGSESIEELKDFVDSLLEMDFTRC